MTISLYAISVPPFRRYLQALSGVLDKGVAFAEARKIDPSVLLHSRLAPDMFPLLAQVQRVSDHVKNGTARLAAIPAPPFADDETSFAALQDRLARTRAFIDSVAPAQIDGGEDREIVLKFQQELRFSGIDYLFNFLLPNVLFHYTTAYDILRHNGVEIGKRDFIGGR
jgi:hypothetical protein